MSWVVDEWKDGLPTRALQKIQEMESQLDKLKKERQQRQFQLESMEAAFQKQKQKVENEKNEVTAIKRENQCLVESCNNLEKSRQKITHDLQVKEQQVNNLKGEISSSKKLVEKLEHELKRCKLDLERNPETSALVDLQQCGSPQKSFAAPVTPCQRLNDSKLEVLQEKYNKEVEERKRLEAELKILQVKIINQSSVNRKDIARHQAASSVFPWQQEQTPSRQSHSSLETPLKSGSGTSAFLWEQEETPYKCDLRSAKKVSDLKTKVSELELRLQAQEKDLKNHMNKLSEIQRLYEKAKLELEEKDKNLSKCRDELTRVTGQFDQTTSKCTLVEQKLKQLSLETSTSQKEELQSNMVLQEQKMKDMEGEYKQRLQEMEAKVDVQESNIAWLKKEKDSVLSKMQLWMKSCKQLEMDKEALQKEIEQKDDCLKGSDSNVEELQSKLEELTEALEEKTKEADDSMEKYCSIMINLHKLEETNEMLKNRVALLCSQVLPPKQEEPASADQHKNDPKLVDNVKPLEKISSPRVQSRLSTKRQRASENVENENQFKADGIKGDKKRIKGSVTPTVARRSTTDDVELQPEGLPDVVKKGEC
ncbi:UNVERIFIED_CONTAM: hypothetical protein FKN15_055998 [Acipenser sinensis]